MIMTLSKIHYSRYASENVYARRLRSSSSLQVYTPNPHSEIRVYRNKFCIVRFIHLEFSSLYSKLKFITAV